MDPNRDARKEKTLFHPWNVTGHLDSGREIKVKKGKRESSTPGKGIQVINSRSERPNRLLDLI